MRRGESLGYQKGVVLRDGRYQVDKEISRGGSAIVYLARDLHNHNQKVALKVMDYTQDLTVLHRSVKREVTFSAYTQHPNIVRLMDVFADKQRRTLVIVWELVDGPDLLECINKHGGPLPEPEAAFYFCQLLRGLLFMHETGFAHRDIKPENCVLQEATGTVKLIDFGLTKHIESARTMLVGTPEYMAPELVKNPTPQAGNMMRYNQAGDPQPAGGGSGRPPLQTPYDARKVDAWAMGVLFYVLVCAQYPFTDPNNPASSLATQRNLVTGRYRALPKHVSEGAKALVKGLLVVEPEDRMNLDEVASNPWLLAAANGYATPRNLQHLVQPPLTPAPQLARTITPDKPVARSSSGGSQQQQQHQQPVLRQTITGSSQVSVMSDTAMSADSVGTSTTGAVGAIAAVTTAEGQGVGFDQPLQQQKFQGRIQEEESVQFTPSSSARGPASYQNNKPPAGQANVTGAKLDATDPGYADVDLQADRNSPVSPAAPVRGVDQGGKGGTKAAGATSQKGSRWYRFWKKVQRHWCFFC